MKSSSSWSDEDVLKVLHTAAAYNDNVDVPSLAQKNRGGSKQGKAANRHLNIKEKCKQFDADFLCCYRKGSLLFTKLGFQRAIQMPRRMDAEVRTKLLGRSPFYDQKPHATGQLGGTIDLKIYTTLQMIADNQTAFLLVKEGCQSDSRNMECMKCFCEDIVKM